MLIKLLTEARKGRENSSTKCDKYGGQRPAGPRLLWPENGYLQQVMNNNNASETSHLFWCISVLIQRYNAVAFQGSFVEEEDDVSG